MDKTKKTGHLSTIVQIKQQRNRNSISMRF